MCGHRNKKERSINMALVSTEPPTDVRLAMDLTDQEGGAREVMECKMCLGRQ